MVTNLAAKNKGKGSMGCDKGDGKPEASGFNAGIVVASRVSSQATVKGIGQSIFQGHRRVSSSYSHEDLAGKSQDRTHGHSKE